MTIESSKKGKAIEDYLAGVNMDPWYYIYENYIQNNSKEKLNQAKKEQDSID
ncbi:MAG: hypothetical protein OEL56_06515 [Nitrosopumilus sp.]|nr:hypothetical protein [Nitrosopumilus sp.]MDH3565142.1 hypothetical protein [Nitrosopumilus sp.]MDH5416896.1 hypothetical protein [Nitrosopumilus sp.]